MTGRGIDQILPCPGYPALHEPFVTDARDYVQLAQEAHGAFRTPVEPGYIWGDALREWEGVRPDVRITNLETSITQSDDYWPHKEIHYKMSPANLACLAAAGFDCCSLANNHVLDWGYRGLAETLAALRGAGIRIVGAGENLQQAQTPAVLHVTGKGRVLVVGLASDCSGIPWDWAAQQDRAGVNLQDLSPPTAWQIGRSLAAQRRPHDAAIVSIHWGGNWGYDIPEVQSQFAHELIDSGRVDIVHGHSSHHVKGIEVYRQRLILYGCGDFLTDYEGIAGYESYRSNLSVMYFAGVDAASGALQGLRMAVMRMRQMRLQRAPPDDVHWLRNLLNREGKVLGTQIDLADDESLVLRW
jgi:poly-gamma-glutamate synthesis protein (capsule biosynthesis protein)